MIVKELKHCKSLKDARLIVEAGAMDQRISGINVLEAPDIELWGRKGMVLLTSFFALRDSSDAELEDFFKKLKHIGVAALVVKIRRLVAQIPAKFITLCEENSIPLIEIDENTRYEEIIVEVMSTMLAKREKLLSIYYQADRIASDLSIEMLGLHEILHRYQQILPFHMAVYQAEAQLCISTLAGMRSLSITQQSPLPETEYSTAIYESCLCHYFMNNKATSQEALLVDISCIEAQRHYLIVFHPDLAHLPEEDIVVIENLISLLQLTLLREWSLKQKIMQDKNALIDDLLHGRLNREIVLADTYRKLDLNPAGQYVVLTLNYRFSDRMSELEQLNFKSIIRHQVRKADRKTVYYTSTHFDKFLLSAKNRLSQAQNLETLLKDLLLSTIHSKHVQMHGGISAAGPLRNISAAAEQSEIIAYFIKGTNQDVRVTSYEDMGILRLFLDQHISNYSAFVPAQMRSLAQNHPEVYLTLKTYLENNRNITKTAAALFLHPKTIKYRLAKLPELLDLDINDSHDLTIILTSIELMRFEMDLPKGPALEAPSLR